jgi:hypothetical protein
MTDLISVPKATLQQALKALEHAEEDGNCEYGATAALRAALEKPERAHAMRDAGYTRRPTLREMADPEQPEQEPVAYLYHDAQSAHDANPLLHSTLLVFATERRPEYRNETPLFTHPPRREWRGLTDNEIINLVRGVLEKPANGSDTAVWQLADGIARAVEAALKERNA